MLTLLFYFIIAFASLIALGQVRGYMRERKVRRYFQENNLSHILVCTGPVMKDFWSVHLDKQRLANVRIISITPGETYHEFKDARLLEAIVTKTGVMQLPCLLTLTGDQITGQYFEGNK